MKVEIWSDIMCPFCYIGKRNFENALEEFSQRDQIQVIWKSFALAPDLQTDTSIDSNLFLQKHKGMSGAQATEAIKGVTQMAKASGLDYDYDNVVVANTKNGNNIAKIFYHIFKMKILFKIRLKDCIHNKFIYKY